MNSISIHSMSAADRPSVRAIYAEGIAGGSATFETQPPEWDAWNASHLPGGRIVARIGGEVVGWAALSPVSSRRVYAGVAEVSVYVAGAHQGRGVGLALLWALIEASEQMGLWTLQAGIFAENLASMRLHQKAGFRMVGRREKIGCLNGVWRDTILMERRSPVVGLS